MSKRPVVRCKVLLNCSACNPIMIWSLKMHSSHSMHSLWRLFYLIKEGLNFLCSPVSIAHNLSLDFAPFPLHFGSSAENTLSFILLPNSLSNGCHCLKVVGLRISMCFDLEATISAVNGETIVISDVRLFASVYRLQVIITESVSIQNSNIQSNTMEYMGSDYIGWSVKRDKVKRFLGTMIIRWGRC